MRVVVGAFLEPSRLGAQHWHALAARAAVQPSLFRVWKMSSDTDNVYALESITCS